MKKPIDVLRELTQGLRLTDDEKEAIARAIELYEAIVDASRGDASFRRALGAHTALDGGTSERPHRVGGNLRHYPWPTGVRPRPRELLEKDKKR